MSLDPGKCHCGQEWPCPDHSPAAKRSELMDGHPKDAWQKQYLADPYSETPASVLGRAAGPPGPTAEATSTTRRSYTGFRLTEHRDFKGSTKTNPFLETTMVDYSWATVPWYARLAGLVRLPYDLAKFVITGRLILIPWPWRW